MAVVNRHASTVLIFRRLCFSAVVRTAVIASSSFGVNMSGFSELLRKVRFASFLACLFL